MIVVLIKEMTIEVIEVESVIDQLVGEFCIFCLNQVIICKVASNIS